jgi:hypothetical protein
MVLDPRLRLISGWGDSEIHRPVDQTNTRPACAAGAFGDKIQKVSRRLWTRSLGAAVREHPFFVADFKLDSAPFRCQWSKDGLGFHAKQRTRRPLVHRLRRHR